MNVIDRGTATALSGSVAERELQERAGTRKRAEQFYRLQVIDHLNDTMRSFIAARELMFVSTSDAGGNCDATIRAGAPGFVHVLDKKTLIYPEYRGNGVMASLANITENGHVGLLFVDFHGARIGLHVNGSARLISGPDAPVAVDERYAELSFADGKGCSALDNWVAVTVDEAYIHCSKHIPRFEPLDAERRAQPREDEVRDGDFFRVRRDATLT